MRKPIRALLSRFSQWLLGHHPYNTIFNFNWVNVYPLIRILRELESTLSLQGRFVDLGAGASPYYDLIAKNASSYIAVDYLSALPRKDARPIQRVSGTAEATPFADESIDVVFCSQVLSQVQHPENAFCEIRRILRSRGYAIISVPHISPLHSEPYDLYRFTPDGLNALACAAGLQPRSMHIQGQLFASFALCLAMNLILSPISERRPMRVLPKRQLLFAPLIAFVNVGAYLLDKILPFNRTPINFVFVAVKP